MSPLTLELIVCAVNVKSPAFTVVAVTVGADNTSLTNVKFVLSLNKPAVPANVKRPAVKLSTLAVPACA